MTYDTPALHQDGRLPVLDLAVWVYDNQIYHSFFKKEVSSKFTVMKRSAMSNTVNHFTCFQECVRRILNISPGLPWNETVRHINQYSFSLYESGYSMRERYELIKGAVMRVETLKEKARQGKQTSLYRDMKSIAKARWRRRTGLILGS